MGWRNEAAILGFYLMSSYMWPYLLLSVNIALQASLRGNSRSSLKSPICIAFHKAIFIIPGIQDRQYRPKSTHHEFLPQATVRISLTYLLVLVPSGSFAPTAVLKLSCPRLPLRSIMQNTGGLFHRVWSQRAPVAGDIIQANAVRQTSSTMAARNRI